MKVLFVGDGIKLEECIELVNNGKLQDTVHFLGYRKDVDRLYQISDVLVTSALQEGLPINVIEGMASGLPIVCADIRGQVDVVTNDVNGYLYETNNEKQFENAIVDLYSDENKRIRMGQRNLIDVKKFSLERAIKNMSCIYKDYM